MNYLKQISSTNPINYSESLPGQLNERLVLVALRWLFGLGVCDNHSEISTSLDTPPPASRQRGCLDFHTLHKIILVGSHINFVFATKHQRHDYPIIGQLSPPPPPPCFPRLQTNKKKHSNKKSSGLATLSVNKLAQRFVNAVLSFLTISTIQKVESTLFS